MTVVAATIGAFAVVDAVRRAIASNYLRDNRNKTSSLVAIVPKVDGVGFQVAALAIRPPLGRHTTS